MNPETQGNTAGNTQEFVFDKYIAIALIVGLVAGFVIGNSVKPFSSSKGQIYAGNAAPASLGINSTGTLPANVVDDTSATADWLQVSDQKAGNAVDISKITLDKTYWVAVRDNAETTAHPYVLGAVKLMPGTYSDFSVYVSRDTEAGKSYDVVFYNDSANFDPTAQSIIMSGSVPLRATFTAN